MASFVLASDFELRTVFGKGGDSGDSSSSSSDSGSSGDVFSQIGNWWDNLWAPAVPLVEPVAWNPPELSAPSTLPNVVINPITIEPVGAQIVGAYQAYMPPQDPLVIQTELTRAATLAAGPATYGSNNPWGSPNALNKSSYDCSGAMSAVTQKDYHSVSEILYSSNPEALGYEKVASSNEPGTWTLIHYVDGTGVESYHTQMTVGNGEYFDSVPDTGTRNGPSYSGKSTEDYVRGNGWTIKEISYVRPTK